MLIKYREYVPRTQGLESKRILALVCEVHTPVGNAIENLPAAGPTIGRRVVSPNGNFETFMTFWPDKTFIGIMRLTDGARWPLQVQADFAVRLVDWF